MSPIRSENSKLYQIYNPCRVYVVLLCLFVVISYDCVQSVYIHNLPSCRVQLRHSDNFVGYRKTALRENNVE